MRELDPSRENLQECPKYFLGVVPDKEFRDAFTNFLEPRQSKLPSHITVIPPFYNLLNNEGKLINFIRNRCSKIPILFVGISYKLGYFPKGRVVHYQFDKWTIRQLKEAHSFILNGLYPGIGINSEFIGEKYNPHILIPHLHSKPRQSGVHKDKIFTSFLCNSLELWKKGGGTKDWTEVAKVNLMDGYYVDGNYYNVKPIGLKKYLSAPFRPNSGRKDPSS